MDLDAIEQAQAGIYKRYAQHFIAGLADSIMGVADPTLGHDPIHGLRHTPEGNTNGWYVWAGEYSSATDFFSHLQTAHLLENETEGLNSFDLSRDCRFLLAKDYAHGRSQLRS